VLWPVAAVVLLACLGATRWQLRFWKNSETLARQALRVTGANYMAYCMLGDAVTEPEEKVNWFLLALRLNPDDAYAHCNLAGVLQRQGKSAEAIAHYQAALRVETNKPMPFNNLAWLLATHRDARYRNGEEAVRLASRAVELTRSQEAGFLDTLAAAYAEAGRFAEAVAAARRALELADAGRQNELIAQIQKRLSVYESGQAYRQ
jgi:tetratricopeptide (TPR) repeat protein